MFTLLGAAWQVYYMGVAEDMLHEGLIHGVQSIRREIQDFGTDEDKECLDYILNQTAGSSE